MGRGKMGWTMKCYWYISHEEVLTTTSLTDEEAVVAWEECLQLTDGAVLLVPCPSPEDCVHCAHIGNPDPTYP